MYSQNGEDKLIDKYFQSIGVEVKTVLDIGANDGVTFSNSRMFFRMGATVYLVEPSEVALIRLRETYKNANDIKYQILPYALGDKEEDSVSFYESGTLLKTGDTALVSTFFDSEKARWGNSVDYKEIKVNVITFKLLLQMIGTEDIDFISIDVEGYDDKTKRDFNFEILKQIDFNRLKNTRVVCVENNGKNTNVFNSWMFTYGFRLHHQNGENLIFVR